MGAACTRAGSWIINIISRGFSVALLVAVALFVGLAGSTMCWVALGVALGDVGDVVDVALLLVDWDAVVGFALGPGLAGLGFDGECHFERGCFFHFNSIQFNSIRSLAI